MIHFFYHIRTFLTWWFLGDLPERPGLGSEELARAVDPDVHDLAGVLGLLQSQVAGKQILVRPRVVLHSSEHPETYTKHTYWNIHETHILKHTRNTRREGNRDNMGDDDDDDDDDYNNAIGNNDDISMIQGFKGLSKIFASVCFGWK